VSEASTTSVLREGEGAPSFDLPGAGGERIALSAFAGKTLALYFYPKDDTSGCTKEAIEFNALLKDFAKANAAVVGVSPDSPAKHDKFRAKYELAFPLASDEGRRCSRPMGCGSRRACTAANIWASSARPS
jgi:peroxiredoxin Q/BCP